MVLNDSMNPIDPGGCKMLSWGSSNQGGEMRICSSTWKSGVLWVLGFGCLEAPPDPAGLAPIPDDLPLCSQRPDDDQAAPSGATGAGMASAVGDFDGDGILDAAYGAPESSWKGLLSVGAVVVCWGQHSTDQVAWAGESCDLLHDPEGPAAEAEFGFALSTMRHPSGAKDRLLVGTPGSDRIAEGRGAVSQITFEDDPGSASYRTPSHSTTISPSIGLEPGDIGTRFGHALAAGDLNDDGYDDVIVGEPFLDLVDPDSNVVVDAGVAHVVLYPQVSPVADLVVHDIWGYVQAGEGFGSSVAAGHLSGEADELDVAVGAPSFNGSEGRVVVVDDVGSVAKATKNGVAEATFGFQQDDGVPAVLPDGTGWGVDPVGYGSFYAPAAKERYGESLAILDLPPESVVAPIRGRRGFSQQSNDFAALVVGVPGQADRAGAVAGVGTVCVVDVAWGLADGAQPGQQLCVDLEIGLGARIPAPARQGMMTGTSVSVAYSSSVPLGASWGVEGPDILLGAPGLKVETAQSGVFVEAGAILVLPVQPMADTNQLRARNRMGILRGDKVAGQEPPVDDLRVGTTIAADWFTDSPAEQILAGVPGLSTEGGLAWTGIGMEGDPSGTDWGAAWYEWNHDPSADPPDPGWPGDSLRLLVVEQAGNTTQYVQVYSPENSPWTMTVVVLEDAVEVCNELPVNSLSAEADSWSVLPTSDWPIGSESTLSCSGAAGTWGGHVATAEEACGSGGIAAGDPWPTPIYAPAPTDTCLMPLEQVLHPRLLKIAPGTPTAMGIDRTAELNADPNYSADQILWHLAMMTDSQSPVQEATVALFDDHISPQYPLHINNENPTNWPNGLPTATEIRQATHRFTFFRDSSFECR